MWAHGLGYVWFGLQQAQRGSWKFRTSRRRSPCPKEYTLLYHNSNSNLHEKIIFKGFEVSKFVRSENARANNPKPHNLKRQIQEFQPFAQALQRGCHTSTISNLIKTHSSGGWHLCFFVGHKTVIAISKGCASKRGGICPRNIPSRMYVLLTGPSFYSFLIHPIF